MFKELRFALYAMKKNIQSSAELRTSFLMNVVGMAINNSAFIILWVFFVKSVGVIGGWTAVDIIGLQGFNAFAFGIVFSLAGGLRKLPDYVYSGAFDRFMLSPKNLLMRIATSAFMPSAVGDIVFGIVCITIFGIVTHFTYIQIILALVLLIFAMVMFVAATITAYSTSFLFMDSRAIVDGIFETFMTPSLFHGGAFQGIMRFIFTFLIPSLVIAALPVEAIRDISFGKLALIGVVSIGWLCLALYVFSRAVRRYESSNFMTFGS